MPRIFTCRRVWAQEQKPTPLPLTLADIVIPSTYTLKKDGSRFLHFNSGVQDPNMFIIFCSPQMVKVLQTPKKWFVNGTFKLVPALFFQVCSVHCEVDRSVLPATYTLLTQKDRTTYTRALTALNGKCGGA